MHSDSGHTTSVWMGTTEVPTFQPLTQDLRTNVCVIGAGIAGMTTAYLLARAGRAVVVIDDGPIGGGETSRTTAHLTAAQSCGTTTSRAFTARKALASPPRATCRRFTASRASRRWKTSTATSSA